MENRPTKRQTLTRTAKFLITLALAVAAVLTVTATLGYLTSQSNQATNTATFGSIGISVPETSFVPMQTPEPGGDKILKNPTVKNETGTPAYIRARVVAGDVWTYYNGDDEGFNEAKWQDGGDGYFYYKEVLPGEKDAETEPLFTSVQLKANANISDAGQLNIIVYAEAVQQWVDTSGFDEAVSEKPSWFASVGAPPGAAEIAYKSFWALNNPQPTDEQE